MTDILLRMKLTFLAFDWTFDAFKSIWSRFDCFTVKSIFDPPVKTRHLTDPAFAQLRQRDRSKKVRKGDTKPHAKRSKEKHISCTCLVVTQDHEFVLSVTPQPSML